MSGTRMCLLALFGFLLVVNEFPEFSRFKPKSAGEPAAVDMSADDGAYYVADSAGPRILVDAQWGYGGWGRRWGGYGGWGGGWGYRRLYYGGWGGGWGWRRRGWGWG